MIGDTEAQVLVVLVDAATDGPVHFGGLYQAFAETLSKDVSIGALHTTCERLVGKGYVESWYEDGGMARKGRPKRYFKITANGHSVLKQKLESYQKVLDLHKSGGLAWL